MSSRISNHSWMYFPLRGGVAIHNPSIGNYGTLGFVATSDGVDRWLVSCHHVLCRMSGAFPPGVVEPIYYPLDFSRKRPIASVSSQRADPALDCAAALIPDRLGIGHILGIGKLAQPTAPVLGMRVLKSGAETGVTEGRIVRLDPAQIEIAPPLEAPDGYELCEGGDSGALWIDAHTLSPVALHYQGSDWGTPERAFARPIHAVLAALQLTVLID